MQHSFLLSQIHSWIGQTLFNEPDRELLNRFVHAQDQKAFAMLLDRHGPMILGICQRILGDLHLAEDVFQATFLVLARKADSLRNSDALPAWLHRTALRLALRKKQSLRDRSMEVIEPVVTTSVIDELSARELLTILDEELNRLSESYRSVIILCCLEGHSREEAAKVLGCAPGSIKSRLERGRNQLRSQLTKRGLHLPIILGTPLILVPTIAVSASVRSDTLNLLHPNSVIPSRIEDLVEKIMYATIWGRFQVVCYSIVLLGGLSLGWNLLSAQSSNEDKAKRSEVLSKKPAETQGQGKDLYGDPLPEGAAMRLGTIQRRAVNAQFAITKDGKFIVTLRGDRYLRIWDTDSGKLRESRKISFDSPGRAWLSPDGRWVATPGNHPNRFHLVNVQSGKKEYEFSLKGPFKATSSIGFSPDGNQLVTNCYVDENYQFQVWDIATQKEILSKSILTNETNTFVAFTPNGSEVVASFSGNTMGTLVLNLESGKVRIHSGCIATTPIFTADGQSMIAQSQGNKNAMDLPTGRAVKLNYLPEFDSNRLVHFLQDGKRVLISKEGGILVWDWDNAKELRFLKGASEEFVVAPDGKTIVTNDGTLQRWDLETGKPLYPDTFKLGHVQEVVALKFSLDGKYLVSGSRDGSVRLWNTISGKPLQVWSGHQALQTVREFGYSPPGYQEPETIIPGNSVIPGVQAVDISPDGNWIVSAGSEERLLIRDVANQKTQVIELPRSDPKDPSSSVFQLQVSRDSSQVVALFGAPYFDIVIVPLPPEHTDKMATWDLKSGKLLSVVPVERGGLDFHVPQERTIREGKVVNFSSQKSLASLEGFGTPRDRKPFRFSSDGSLIIGTLEKMVRVGTRTAPDFGDIRIWESASGKILANLSLESKGGQIGFLPNHRFAFASTQEGITIWDWKTEKVVHQRLMPELISSTTSRWSCASCVAFSPDGKRMATGLRDSTILIWDLPLSVR